MVSHMRNFWLTRNVILWLSDIHPESLHIIRVELVISGNSGEDLLFDRSRAGLTVSSCLFRTRELTSIRSKTEGLKR